MMKFLGIESQAEKAERQQREAAERERKAQARAAGINPDALSTLSGHTHYVRALTVLPDGRLASGSFDHTINAPSRDTCKIATQAFGL